MTYPILPAWKAHAHIDEAQYHTLYQQSIDDPGTFWALQAERYITWISPWDNVLQGSFATHDVTWFANARLNACYNCLDRHLETHRDRAAFIWEGNEPSDCVRLTYGELYTQVCRFANVLKQKGIQKGDRVCIYLPMIPELIVAMLACARIGAVHSVVFAGFSPEALKTRVLDAQCTLIVTADEGMRGEKVIPLKQQVDLALANDDRVNTVIVVKRRGMPVAWCEGRDVWYHALMNAASAECPIEPMDANDPLFILYTSGSTGQPKGVVHGTGGYLVYAAFTFQTIFDHQEHDVFWCTADAGWITGHSYLVYGPLLNAATSVLFEGVPNYPTYARFWEVIDRHQVSLFYTAPTAIRALRQQGEAYLESSSRRSLRVLGTVGEPISPQVWEWYYHAVGRGQCPIVNTWWQTETGGIVLSAFPGATPLIPGSVGWPFFGIRPALVDDTGQVLLGNKQAGQLVIQQPWPGMMLTVFGDHQRFIETYFSVMPGCYSTGDGAYRDEQGMLWVTGRNDDVINVSGHRLGTGELESALLCHPAVAEAAVVAVPHDIKGQGIVAFVTLKTAIEASDALKKALVATLRNEIGALATPERIEWAPALPKTRSGKIMRRLLRQIALKEDGPWGDLSTLADPGVIQALVAAVSDR